MEKKTLENAVDDISLIKNIIESTRKSFIGFSKIFVCWGILFACFGLLQAVQSMNQEATMQFYMKYNELLLILPLLLFFIAAFIYTRVVKKQPLVGLERHLMLLWILILLLQVMPTRVTVNSMNDANFLVDGVTPIAIQKVVTTTNNFSITVFSLGIALVMTSVFTDLKKIKYLGFLYFALAFVHGYLPNLSYSLGLSNLGFVILPFTLLFTGVYLKKHHERSEISGTQLNS